jgi:hypothetical protein
MTTVIAIEQLIVIICGATVLKNCGEWWLGE